MGSIRGAIAALMRAISLNHSCIPAAELLVEAIPRAGYWALSHDARDSLRGMAGWPAGEIPGLLLMRLKYERLAGSGDSVVPLIHRFLQVGGDSAVGLLELARQQFIEHNVDGGVRSYFEGAAYAGKSAVGREVYRGNVRWIASSREMEAFDSLSPKAVPGWIHDFWARRDAAAGLSPGRRLTEHFRRYEYATRHFGILGVPVRRSGGVDLSTDVPVGIGDSGSALLDRLLGNSSDTASLLAKRGSMTNEEFDARGPVYMRLGAPDDRAGSWWAYYRHDGNLYLPVVPGMASLPGSRCELDPAYCFPPTPGVVSRWDRELTRMIATAREADEFTPNYRRTLKPIAQFYGWRRGDVPSPTSGRILFVFAVPADELAFIADSLTGRIFYNVRFRLIAATPDGASRTDLDTTRTFVASKRLGQGEYLTGFLDLPIAPGVYNVRAAIEQPDSGGGRAGGYEPELIGGRGAVVSLDGVSVPDTRPDSLVISDLLLGREHGDLQWQPRLSEAVTLNPLNAYRKDDTAILYYEVSGLRPGQAYRTTIELSRGDMRYAKPVSSVSFIEPAAHVLEFVRRSLMLTSIPAGTYWVTLTIRPSDSDKGVSRTATLNLVN